MKNYKIRIEIDRADNGYYMYANINGEVIKEVHGTKEELYNRLNGFRQAVDEIETARKEPADT